MGRCTVKMTFISNSVAETETFGEKFAQKVYPGMVIAMYGDLGAGKTAFVRGLARGMGIRTRVTSPTFSIVNEYTGCIPLYHFDMYRLSSAEELFDIGWEDYMRKKGVCVVEWAENVAEIFENDVVRVNIRRISENSREISVLGLDIGGEIEP